MFLRRRMQNEVRCRALEDSGHGAGVANVRGEGLDADLAATMPQPSLDPPQPVMRIVDEANVLSARLGNTTCDLGSDRAGGTSDEHAAPPKELPLGVMLGADRNPAEQLVKVHRSELRAKPA